MPPYCSSAVVQVSWSLDDQVVLKNVTDGMFLAKTNLTCQCFRTHGVHHHLSLINLRDSTIAQWLALPCHLSVWSLHVLPVSVWVPSRYSSFLLQSKHMQVGLIGDPKLPLGGNQSMNGCLSLYVSPVMNWQLVQSVPPTSPSVSWDWLQFPPRPFSKLSGYG